MKIRTALAGAVAGAGALLAITLPASAYIACNREGDCWHTEDRTVPPPGVHFSFHPDDWYFHRHWNDEHMRWRDYREGRGYWRNGVWITL